MTVGPGPEHNRPNVAENQERLLLMKVLPSVGHHRCCRTPFAASCARLQYPVLCGCPCALHNLKCRKFNCLAITRHVCHHHHSDFQPLQAYHTTQVLFCAHHTRHTPAQMFVADSRTRNTHCRHPQQWHGTISLPERGVPCTRHTWGTHLAAF